MSEDKLIHIKGSLSPEGGGAVELDLGPDVPKALASLFPNFAMKSRAKRLISQSIIDKIQRGIVLDSADVEYAEMVFGEPEARWMRRWQIAARAVSARKAIEIPAQLPPSDSSSSTETMARETAEDWINKFWDDAELVSDEVLQEIYARVLAAESQRPGCCSLRTLRALRYIDRDTADRFARLVPAVFSLAWVPRDAKLLDMFELSYDLLIDLDDAGIVESDSSLNHKFAFEKVFVACGSLVLSLHNASGLEFGVFPLKLPGRELARVAQVERNREHFFAVARWLISRRTNLQASWAELPNPLWTGPEQMLSWEPIPSS